MPARFIYKRCRQAAIQEKNMFNEVICIQLQLAITSLLKQSVDREQGRCWCNGVVPLDNSALYSIEQILKNRQLVAKAWIDEGLGEDEGLQYLYALILKFGDKSAQSLKAAERLDACFRDDGFDSWKITLDKVNKTIDVQIL